MDAAGRVWIDEFNKHFKEWLASRRSDEQLLVAAADDLKNLLSQTPDNGELVQSMALGAAFNARLAARPETVAIFARIGHDADLLEIKEDSNRSGARILLNLYIAEAELRCRNQYDGLDALIRAEQFAVQQPPHERLSRYLSGYRSYLRGALCELGLAVEQAVKAYGAAAEHLDELARQPDQLVESATTLLDLLFRDVWRADEQKAEQAFLLAAAQIQTIISLNALGYIRARSMSGNNGDLTQLASAAWDMVYRAGVPDEVNPLDVVPLVQALPEKLADKCIAIFVDKVGRARGDRENWQTVLVAAVLSRRKKQDARRKQWEKNLAAAMTKVKDPLLLAYARSRTLMASMSGGRPTVRAMREFLEALRELAGEPRSSIDELGVRALFDEPISICVDWLRREFEAAPTALNRTRFAIVLDALRGNKLSELAALPEHMPDEASPEAGLLPALDRLQRIAHALKQQPEAAAIVLQRLSRGYLFVCVTADPATPIVLIEAGPEFEAGARELQRTVQNIMDAADVSGIFPGDDAVTPIGKSAYQALPAALRQLIESHQTLLIVPDYRANTDDIPFELFHDGKTHLGHSRVIARFVSLRSLVRTCERRTPRIPQKRALVMASSQPPGWPELPGSRLEVQRVRAALEKDVWDAPTIEESRVSSKFVVDRLQHVSWLHISAHGDVAVDEAIVLPDGTRFTTDDMLRRRYPALPAAYFNTCSLGRTRYVGGGLSRGIAHTFVEGGAPAAVANLLPVEDRSASDLALEFYAQCRRHSLGDALRLARGKLARRGVHPVLWGSTVLTGNPWITLVPRALDQSVAEQLLEAYFSRQPKQQERDIAWQQAVITLARDRGDVRLQAVVKLLRWAGVVTSLATPKERQQWKQVIRLADEIEYLPAMALVRYVQICNRDPDLSARQRLVQIDDAIHHIEAVAAMDPAWKPMLMDAQTLKTSELPDAPRLTIRRPAMKANQRG